MAIIKKIDWNSPLPQPAHVVSSSLVPSGLVPFVGGPVSASLDQSSINEDFFGFVSLTINGLETGETVLLEKFLVTTAGTIDGSSILIQSIRLTDGQLALTDEVDNLNILADSTAADGSILAEISFLNSYVPNIVGLYVYRVSSPTSRFGTVTVPFAVTPATWNEHVLGTVKNGANPVPFAQVVALELVGGSPDFYGGVVADANGAFNIGLFPDSYQLVALKDGFVSPIGPSTRVQLTEGADTTFDIPLEAGTRTISGKVTDSIQTSQGLAGMQVIVLSTDGSKVAVSYTDENGDFSLSVTPGVWFIRILAESLTEIGYLDTSSVNQVDVSAGDVTGLQLPLNKGTGLIFGTLTGAGAAALEDVRIRAVRQDLRLRATSVTDDAGEFYLAVTPGVWFVFPENEALEALNHVGNEGLLVFIDDGQAVEANLVVVPVTAKISGVVKDDANQPVADLPFWAFNADGSGDAFLFNTEPDGSFEIGVGPGIWYLEPSPLDLSERGLIPFASTPITISSGSPSGLSPSGLQPADVTGLNIVVKQAAATLQVTVVDSSNNPVPNFGVYGYADISSDSFDTFGRTDPSGVATLPAFDGSWTLNFNYDELSFAGFREKADTITSVSSGTGSIQIQLTNFTGTRPALDQFNVGSGNTSLRLTGEPGRYYTIDGSLDLKTWQRLDQLPAEGGSFQFTDNFVEKPAFLFYRARAE